MAQPPSQLRLWLKNYNQRLEAWRSKDLPRTPELNRDGLATLTRQLVSVVPEVPFIKDDEVTEGKRCVPVRIYHPEPGKNLPVLLYLHGGGHVAGSVQVYDPICRKLCLATRHTVISVDYRLAPEFPYPDGLNDCSLVLRRYPTCLGRHGITPEGHPVLAGDSAGGALGASLALGANEKSAPRLAALILIYPSLDYTLGFSSVDLLESGYLLEREGIRWYFANYFQHDEDLRRVSPLHMALPEKMPRTLIVTAGLCPLQDEGFEFAQRLRLRHTEVRQLHFDDMIHAFLNLEDLVPDQCRNVYKEIGAFLHASS